MPSACEVCGRDGGSCPQRSGTLVWQSSRLAECYHLGYERQRARAEKLEKALREASVDSGDWRKLYDDAKAALVRIAGWTWDGDSADERTHAGADAARDMRAIAKAALAPEGT